MLSPTRTFSGSVFSVSIGRRYCMIIIINAAGRAQKPSQTRAQNKKNDEFISIYIIAPRSTDSARSALVVGAFTRSVTQNNSIDIVIYNNIGYSLYVINRYECCTCNRSSVVWPFFVVFFEQYASANPKMLVPIVDRKFLFVDGRAHRHRHLAGRPLQPQSRRQAARGRHHLSRNDRDNIIIIFITIIIIIFVCE